MVRSTMDPPPEAAACSPQLSFQPLRGMGVCRQWSGMERGARGLHFEAHRGSGGGAAVAHQRGRLNTGACQREVRLSSERGGGWR
jgi:hypothetical protein